MGMDLSGFNPKSEKGDYFRNNCWWWRPLWDFVCDNVDVITDDDASGDKLRVTFLLFFHNS